MWVSTDVDNVYVTSDLNAGPRLPRLAGAKLDPFLALLLLKRYIAAAQVHLPDPARTDAKIRCLERLSTKADQAPFPIKQDHFGMLAGDTV